MRTGGVGLMGVVAGFALAACTGDATPSAAPSTPDVCASADALRGSLTALDEVQIVQDGADALTKAWSAVQEDWARLADDARAQHADEVDAVQAAADEVQSAVDAARETPTAGTLATAATTVGAFLQDADALMDEVGSTC